MVDPFRVAFMTASTIKLHGFKLGHLVLKNNNIAIDTITKKGCLKSQSPIVVPADVGMPVIVWYNPAGVDSTGRVFFFLYFFKKFNLGE
jgi:hypothetical protein